VKEPLNVSATAKKANSSKTKPNLESMKAKKAPNVKVMKAKAKPKRI